MANTMETRNEYSRIEDYTRYLSDIGRRVTPPPSNKQRVAAQQLQGTKVISLAPGVPNDLQYPATEAVFTLREGGQIRINPDEMAAVMTYGNTCLPALVQWVEDLYKRVHAPPTMDDRNLNSSLMPQICSGGREGVSKCCLTLLEKGDTLIGEEALYQTLVATILPRGIIGVPIKSDEEGMDPGHLRSVLSQWDESTKGRRPRAMYVIPTCSNPTGRTWSEKRKREIYVIAREFHLLIIEDDPYYYLQYSRPLSPSILSMDTDGRVIRLDSFSKTISPGCRVGLIFGPKQIVERIQWAMFADTGGCSKLSQMFIYKVLEAWGYDKFLKHSENMADLYKARSLKCIELCNQYLKGLCEWKEPNGGLFLWLKVLGVDNSAAIVDEMMKRGMFLMEGSVFTMSRHSSPFIRMCFSRATDEELENVMSTFANVLKESENRKS